MKTISKILARLLLLALWLASVGEYAVTAYGDNMTNYPVVTSPAYGLGLSVNTNGSLGTCLFVPASGGGVTNPITTGVLTLSNGFFGSSTTIVTLPDNQFLRGFGVGVTTLTVSNNNSAASFIVGSNCATSDFTLTGPFALFDQTNPFSLWLNNISQSSTIDGLILTGITNATINVANCDWGSAYDSINFISCSNISGVIKNNTFTSSSGNASATVRGVAYSGSINCTNTFNNSIFYAAATASLSSSSRPCALEFGSGSSGCVVTLNNCDLNVYAKNNSVKQGSISFLDAQNSYSTNCTNCTVYLYNCGFDQSKILGNNLQGNQVIIYPPACLSATTNVTAATSVIIPWPVNFATNTYAVSLTGDAGLLISSISKTTTNITVGCTAYTGNIYAVGKY